MKESSLLSRRRNYGRGATATWLSRFSIVSGIEKPRTPYWQTGLTDEKSSESHQIDRRVSNLLQSPMPQFVGGWRQVTTTGLPHRRPEPHW